MSGPSDIDRAVIEEAVSDSSTADFGGNVDCDVDLLLHALAKAGIEVRVKPASTWAVVITGYEPDYSHWVHGPYGDEEEAKAALRAAGFIEPEDGDGRSRWFDAADKLDAFTFQLKPVPTASPYEPVPHPLDSGRWVLVDDTWYLDPDQVVEPSTMFSVASWRPESAASPGKLGDTGHGIYAAQNYGEDFSPGMTPEDAEALARIMRSYQ